MRRLLAILVWLVACGTGPIDEPPDAVVDAPTPAGDGWPGTYALAWSCRTGCRLNMPLRYYDRLDVVVELDGGDLAETRFWRAGGVEERSLNVPLAELGQRCVQLPPVAFGDEVADVAACLEVGGGLTGDTAYSSPWHSGSEWTFTGQRL